jgi:UDP-N-acetylglucosamine--N-acetylmuramyl-(pentapeptide) pyrophosphoryl-undecaprenol N-acetylglucosamine transferase
MPFTVVMLLSDGAGSPPARLGAPRPRSLLYVPDIEPGLALKLLARFADRIAITVDESRQYFSARARLTVTGYPVRESLKRWKIDDARRVLGLVEDLPVLLVTGGSTGARSCQVYQGAAGLLAGDPGGHLATIGKVERT